MHAADPITRLNAALEGRYRIERELGEGGMATVYLADDLKHERKVALKVLKPELAVVVGAERFLAEIKTTANLQHPHILPLHDSGEADGFLYYVMPYIEGETLRERIDRDRQLPVDEALGIATAVANALQVAHEAGIVHRDIKPGNILMSRGEPLVADFGIALAVSAGGGGRLTETGLSLGTPFYMSPEQATGDQHIGPASDTFSLACVLYEMLTGEPPYWGSTAQAVLGKIIQGLPVSASAVRQSVPANVDAAIRKALEKVPADRFTGAQDFVRALADPGFRHGMATAAEARPDRGSWNLLSTSLLSALVVASVLALWGWLRPEAPRPVTRTDLNIGEVRPSLGQAVVVSPDGTTFALAGSDDEGSKLFVRRVDEPVFRALAGTEGARDPAFSPDGTELVYRDNLAGTLLKIPLSGGSPLTVVASSQIAALGPHWGDNGTIVFSGPTGVHTVAETGGSPVDLGIQGRNPHLLPGGRGILVDDGEWINVLDLATDSLWRLIPDGLDASYLPTGHILYGDPQGGLQVVAFDLERLELTGQPVPVQDASVGPFSVYYSVSQEGTLTYTTGGAVGPTTGRLIVADIESGDLEAVSLDPRVWRDPRYSPDGRYVAYASGTSEANIFVFDLELRTTPRQLTSEGSNGWPVWSADGSRIAFASVRQGTNDLDLFVTTVDDDEPPTLVVSRAGPQRPQDWPTDDQLLFEQTTDARRDLWVIDPSTPEEVKPYFEAEATLERVRVSPDRRLALYRSDEAGPREYAIYVRSFPEASQGSRVSPGWARLAEWAPGGDAIYHWGRDTLFVSTLRTEPSFAVLSTDVVLVSTTLDFNALSVHPDGTELLLVDETVSTPTVAGTRSAEPEPVRHMVVFNWFEELKQRMGSN